MHSQDHQIASYFNTGSFHLLLGPSFRPRLVLLRRIHLVPRHTYDVFPGRRHINELRPRSLFRLSTAEIDCRECIVVSSLDFEGSVKTRFLVLGVPHDFQSVLLTLQTLAERGETDLTFELVLSNPFQNLVIFLTRHCQRSQVQPADIAHGRANPAVGV
jgi:hypothetical protein